MDRPPPSATPPEPTYDVLLACRPPEWLHEGFPTVSVESTGTQTALRRRLTGTGQLDVLLEKLSSVGVPLLDVHRVPGHGGEAPTYEVRVEGEVGEPLLRYLSWSHRVVPRQTRVRVRAASAELHRFLRACTEHGASIQRVCPVDPACSADRGTPADPTGAAGEHHRGR